MLVFVVETSVGAWQRAMASDIDELGACRDSSHLASLLLHDFSSAHDPDRETASASSSVSQTFCNSDSAMVARSVPGLEGEELASAVPRLRIGCRCGRGGWDGGRVGGGWSCSWLLEWLVLLTSSSRGGSGRETSELEKIEIIIGIGSVTRSDKELPKSGSPGVRFNRLLYNLFSGRMNLVTLVTLIESKVLARPPAPQQSS